MVQFPYLDRSLLILLNPYWTSKNDSSRPLWGQLEIIGWPEEVRFHNRHKWSMDDCRKLLRVLDEIQLTATAKATIKLHSQEERRRIREDIERLSRGLFRRGYVDWQRIKELCPWLHLTMQVIMQANDEDLQKLGRVIRTL